MTKWSEKIATDAIPSGLVPGTDYIGVLRALGTSPETYEFKILPGSAFDIATRYDFGFSFNLNPGQSDELGRVPIGQKIEIPADFAGSYGWVGAAPDTDYVILMQVESGMSPNTETVATITIASDGSFTFEPTSSPAAAITIEAGSLVHFIAPADSPSDSSISDIDAVIGARIVS